MYHNPNFTNLTFSQKQNELDKLFEESDKTIVGLLNPSGFGVCMTNTIIGMITSSIILMKIIEDRQRCKSLDLCNFMQNIYKCLEKPVPKKIENSDVTVGDVLRTGVLKVSQNIPYVSKYGICGDYLIFKTYSRGLDLATQLLEEPEKKFERLALKSKDNQPREVLRWHVLLNDMFDLQHILYNGQNYYYIYYPHINMLNLNLYFPNPIETSSTTEIRNQQLKPFLINNQQMIINDLNEKISSNYIR
ncbi:hypothetical protein SNEBB_000676 [Seison nebaliae]|nr:hypothetical protein SNEBB_000676 [Seison nebaliae]